MDSSGIRNPKKLILVGGGILLLIIVIIVVLTSKKPVTQQVANTPNPTGEVEKVDPFRETTGTQKNSPVQGALLKVGNEYIYESDLNYELTYYPASNTGEAEQILVDKMIEDSIILQGAQEDGLIKLDSTIYNNRDKDYSKRIETVTQLKDKLDQKATSLEGSVISIWFNNMGVGKLGYEKSKQLALSEITRIHTDLKAKKISMQQAGFQIKNNAALAQIDSSYRANAIFDFSITDLQKITYSPDIDKQIYNLNQGDISPILTGKDLDPQTGQTVDSVYMIAQVTKRNKSTVTSYDQWMDQKKEKYAVEKY